MQERPQTDASVESHVSREGGMCSNNCFMWLRFTVIPIMAEEGHRCLIDLEID